MIVLQMRPAEYWVADGRVTQIRRGETLQDHLSLFEGLSSVLGTRS